MHIFNVPSLVFVSGSSQSGKTTLVRKCLEQLDRMTSQKIDHILWFYTIEAANMPRHVPGVELRQGAPDLEELRLMPGLKCVVLDDALGHFLTHKQELVELTTKLVSHGGMLVFLIVQSLFALDRTARANAQYILLTRANGDKLQIRNLAQQTYPERPRFLTAAYIDAVYGRPYGHLLLDLHCETPLDKAVLTDILDEDHTVYLPKT